MGVIGGGQPQKRKWSPTPSSPNVDPVGVADSSDNLAGPTDGNACQTELFVRESVLWIIHPHSFSRPSPKTESKQQSALSLVGIERKNSMHTLHPRSHAIMVGRSTNCSFNMRAQYKSPNITTPAASRPCLLFSASVCSTPSKGPYR